MDTTYQVLPLVISIISIGTSIWALVRAKLSQNAAPVEMYQKYNEFVLENMEDVGPLTPYSRASNESKKARTQRIFLLGLFNRWRFDINSPEEPVHLRFRKFIMGESPDEFGRNIVANGYSEEVAEECVNLLKEIREKEPYFDAARRNLWSTYFRGYFD